VELGSLPGATESVALAINIEGQVVRASRSETGRHRAFMWTPTGGMRDLGVLPGMDWSIARDISDMSWAPPARSVRRPAAPSCGLRPGACGISVASPRATERKAMRSE
jgi:probable HAF family extracellular repeat protein